MWRKTEANVTSVIGSPKKKKETYHNSRRTNLESTSLRVEKMSKVILKKNTPKSGGTLDGGIILC